MESSPTTSRQVPEHSYPKPAMRRFRVYAFDPLASTSLDSVVFNDAIISLPWEEPWEDALTEGPCGEYIEVIDFDPASGLFYAPVNPNDPLLLAQDGLPPSEGRPQFHQQMVYAVAMKTIRNFERALGRKVLWSPLKPPDGDYSKLVDNGYVKKLRIYPHGLREENAYYSPDKKALLFGYFRASPAEGSRSLPGGRIFTCLSHDIIAHETTHAILDGVHRRFIEGTTLDSLAFHEAFADIVALLQHFTMPEVVRHQLSAEGGRLRARNWLTGLAKQFGDARGMRTALREGIDTEEGKEPQQGAYAAEAEPHARGAYLVGAVFDAFVTIFERRTADLLRLFAGSGQGEMHPDLVRRLGDEATKSADHVLRICVRALDYVPPVDIRFGEFLRAMITADADLVPDDPMRYRTAIAEGFRRRGIFPHDIASLAPDSLMWEAPDIIDPRLGTCAFDERLQLDLTSSWDREHIWRQSHRNRKAVWDWLITPSDDDEKWEDLMGVKLTEKAPHTIRRSRSRPDRPAFEVHSVRTSRRAGPEGQDLRQLIIEVTQKRRGFFSEEQQQLADEGKGRTDPDDRDFDFRGGCTMVVDLRTALPREDTLQPDLRGATIRYVIRKRIDDPARLTAQRDYLSGAAEADLRSMYFDGCGAEPFALLHRS